MIEKDSPVRGDIMVTMEAPAVVRSPVGTTHPKLLGVSDCLYRQN